MFIYIYIHNIYMYINVYIYIYIVFYSVLWCVIVLIVFYCVLLCVYCVFIVFLWCWGQKSYKRGVGKGQILQRRQRRAGM